MSARKITITAEVRTLLAELDVAFQKFDEKTTTLARAGLSDTEAVEVGALREADRSIIAGLAYMLNKASTGRSQK